MNTITAAPSHPSMLETLLCIGLVALLSLGVWSIFTSLPAYGGIPTPPPITQTLVAQPAPVCFDRTREQVIAQGAEAGCPTDPAAYHAATLHQVNG